MMKVCAVDKKRLEAKELKYDCVHLPLPSPHPPTPHPLLYGKVIRRAFLRNTSSCYEIYLAFCGLKLFSVQVLIKIGSLCKKEPRSTFELLTFRIKEKYCHLSLDFYII